MTPSLEVRIRNRIALLRHAARPAALIFCVLATSVCGEQGRFGGSGVTGPTGDTESPVSKVLRPGGAADTVIDITDSLKFTARTTDNVRVAAMSVRLRGVAPFALDTTLMDSTTTATVLTVQKDFTVPLPASAAGSRIAITIASADAAGNSGGDSVTVLVDDPTPPQILVRAPASGVIVPAGGTLRVASKSTDPSGIARAGARIFTRNALGQPVAITGDSLTFVAPLLTVRDTAFNVPIPAALRPGSYTVHAFAIDGSSHANSQTSADISIEVADTAKPFGNFAPALSGAQRVAGDSILVGFRARDLTGVARFTLRGYSKRGVQALGTDTTVARYVLKTVTLPANPTDTTITRYLNAVLTDSTVEKVYIEAVITDVGGNTRTILDSINVVAGPFANLTAPLAGTRVPVGVPLTITVNGRAPNGLTFVGFAATGVIARRDSVAISPSVVTATRSLTLTTTTTTPIGTETIVPFALDNSGNRITGTAVQVAYADTAKPVVTIQLPATVGLPINVGDSVLVRVRVQDNRGVSSVVLTGMSHRGIDSLGTGANVIRYATKTVALSQYPDTTFSRFLTMVAGDSTSESVNIIVTATDSSGNVGVDTASVQIVGGPTVAITRPTAGGNTAPGKSVIVEVRASDPQGVLTVGYVTSGVYVTRDSTLRSPVGGTLPDTATFVDTLTIPLATPLGALTFTPFALDSGRNVSGTNPGVTITVATTASDTVKPQVAFTIGRRIETDDSLLISATDAGGIQRVGFTATLLGGAVLTRDSTTPALNGTLSDVSQTFSLNLPAPPAIKFPASVVVQAFAYDSLGNRGLSVAETLTVVAGKTYPLPAGSQIGDAIYNRNRQELYLTNTAFDRVEVFSLTLNRFVAYIPIGSRPVGIALWPHDTLGNHGDTIIVANSGGTNLSVVDMVSRMEVRRQRLPSYLVSSIKTSTNAGGGLDIKYTTWDFSDRPFHVGALCMTSGAATCNMVRALYSTTPTGAQATPLPNRGYLAWVDLNPGANPGPHVHFVWEHTDATASTDSVEIMAIYDSIPGQPQRQVVLGAGVGVRSNVADLVFQDSTFVRNSGDFLTGLVGEGGPVAFARAVRYNARLPVATFPGTGTCVVAGVALNCTADYDSAVSEAVFVGDLVVNRAARISSIATNFNGRTNFVRADSIYVFDRLLRQTGMMQISGLSVGMDPHPSNDFDAATRGSGGLGGTGSPNNRLLFAARPDSSIDVFDTYFYGRTTDTTAAASAIPIPIRNALIGPVRVADVTGSTVLFGITRFGVVVVTLPTVNNSLFPTRRFTGSP